MTAYVHTYVCLPTSLKIVLTFAKFQFVINTVIRKKVYFAANYYTVLLTLTARFCFFFQELLTLKCFSRMNKHHNWYISFTFPLITFLHTGLDHNKIQNKGLEFGLKVLVSKYRSSEKDPKTISAVWNKIQK